MDQAISPEIKRRRKRKMIVKVSMIVVIGVGVFSFLVNMFQPKIRGAEVNFGGRGGRGGIRVCHGEGGSFRRRDHHFSGVFEGAGSV